MGFALAEGIVARASDVAGVLVLPTERGLRRRSLRCRRTKLNRDRMAKRSLEGRTGCGLCGIEDIKDAIRMPGASRARRAALARRPWPAPMSELPRAPADEPGEPHGPCRRLVLRGRRNSAVARGCRPPQRARQADRRPGPRRTRPGAGLRADVQPLQLRTRAEMRHRRHRRAGHGFRSHRPGAVARAAGPSETRRAVAAAAS